MYPCNAEDWRDQYGKLAFATDRMVALQTRTDTNNKKRFAFALWCTVTVSCCPGSSVPL